MYHERLLVGIIDFHALGNRPCCQGIIEAFSGPLARSTGGAPTFTRNVYPEPFTPAGVKAKGL